jgi:single-strand DNA-binding protein
MGQLIGLVYKEAKIENTDNGKKFMVFTFVEKDSYKDKEGKRRTLNTYFNCIMWNANNLAPYLKKGVQLVLTGNITPHLYTDGHGKPKAGVNFSVAELKFIPTFKPTASEEEELTPEPVSERAE